MKTQLIALLFVSVCVLMYANAKPADVEDDDPAQTERELQEFKARFKKTYVRGSTRHRDDLIRTRLATIRQFNKQNTGCVLEPYSTIDLTPEEFSTTRLGLRPNYGQIHQAAYEQQEAHSEISKRQTQPVPSTYDSRNVNGVNLCPPVPNQGECGSCWAFSVVAATEINYRKKYNKAVGLSEQQFVSCDRSNYGCNGGWPSNAMNYARSGIFARTTYPYAAATRDGLTNGTCFTFANSVKTPTTGFLKVADKNEAELCKAVFTYGSVTAAVWVNDFFQNYRSGVYSTRSNTEKVNHAIVIVGCTPTHMILRNSWGPTWGEAGYMRIARGLNLVRFPEVPLV